MTAADGTFAAVTVDCLDVERASRFWAALLGGEIGEPLPGWRRVSAPGRPDLTFQPVAEPKAGKSRVHVDVAVQDADRAERTVRELGGSGPSERHDYPEGTVRVMADPEGLEFCLVQYYDER